MWKCTRCEKENQDSAEACVNCGHGRTMDYTGHPTLCRIRPEITDNWKLKKEKPTLMTDCIQDEMEMPVVFGSDILRNEIVGINFVQCDMDHIPKGAWDVSADRSGRIYAWVEDARMFSGKDLKQLYIASENGMYAPEDCYSLFWRYSKLSSIDFNDLFDTSRVYSMEAMFFGCCELSWLDLSSFDTSQVRTMNGMFARCRNLQWIDLRSFNTSRVETMNGMFWGCRKLRAIAPPKPYHTYTEMLKDRLVEHKELKAEDIVSVFDMSNVQDQTGMFAESSMDPNRSLIPPEVKWQMSKIWKR